VTCAVTLTLFALGGSVIFTLFGITLGAFKIAGGVLIGLNAIDMVQARRSQQQETPVERAEGTLKEDIGIIPLGLPMLAGPGAISTVMVLAGQSTKPVTTFAVYAAIALTAFVSYLTLATATMVERRLGQTGMRILTRCMGLVLCAIAVQFIVDGIKMSGLAGTRDSSPPSPWWRGHRRHSDALTAHLSGQPSSFTHDPIPGGGTSAKRGW
jgi:multiple antibiotic resistance protein